MKEEKIGRLPTTDEVNKLIRIPQNFISGDERDFFITEWSPCYKAAHRNCAFITIQIMVRNKTVQE